MPLADDGVAKLKEELKERNAERDGEIAKLARELTVNRDRQAALEKELLQLREKERGLTGGMDKLRSEKSRAEEVRWLKLVGRKYNTHRVAISSLSCTTYICCNDNVHPT